MRNKRLVPYRERVIGAAEGCVLEIGTGSAVTWPSIDPPRNQILALELLRSWWPWRAAFRIPGTPC